MLIAKKYGHIISEGRRRPQNKGNRALHTSHHEGSSEATMQQVAQQSAPSITPTTPANTPPPANTLPPKVVQQILQSAFSALGLTGKTPTSQLWYVDSGASNRMTFSSSILTDIQPYHGNSKIHTADGVSLPIESIGKFSHSLPLNQVFYSPQLSSKLLFVGQLIDNNCMVSFSQFGCVVQDQVLGKVLVGGPKCRRLFPLISISTPLLNKSLLSFVDSTSDNNVF